MRHVLCNNNATKKNQKKKKYCNVRIDRLDAIYSSAFSVDSYTQYLLRVRYTFLRRRIFIYFVFLTAIIHAF